MAWLSPWWWALLAVLVLAYVAAHISLKEAAVRGNAQMVALQARMRYQQASMSPCTVVENVTCGWLNVLFKVAWPCFISFIGTNLACKQLDNLFAKLSQNLKSKPIFRVAFSQLSLRELSLGAVPPTFDNATARIRPKQREMELELDIDWSTCGCHLVVDSLVLVGDKQWNMKLTAVEIALRGRLRFVLKLSKTCMPGIEGFQFSFVDKPHLTFDISLKGLMFSEVPGLVSDLKRRLLMIIAAEAVEPAKVWVNLENPFYNLYTRKQAGRRGQYKLVLEHATDLKPTRLKSADEDIHDTEECMCFVELRVNGKAYVSPIAEQGSTPEWQWPFYFPVEGEPAGEGCDVAARFTVYNFLAKDQPQILGQGTLDFSTIALADVTRPEPHRLKLKVKSPKGRAGGGGNLFLALKFDTAAARDPDPISGLRNPGIAGALARTAGDANPPPVARGRSMHSLAEEEEDSGASNGVDGAAIRARQDQQSQGSNVYEEDYDDEGLDRRSDFAVAQSIHSAGGGRADLALSLSATKRVQELEQALMLELERRHQEELRSLLEGAPFIMHRGKDKMLRHVWVAVDRGRSRALLRWQSNKGAGWRRMVPGKPGVEQAKAQYNEVDVALIMSITYGNDLFPEVQSQRNRGRTSKAEQAKSSKCFSIMLQIKAASEGEDDKKVAVHLEVPSYGNGRDRNEWASAFNSLMCKKLPLFGCEGSESGSGREN